MLIPGCLFVGLLGEYVAYDIGFHSDPHHEDRDILIALLLAIAVTSLCLVLGYWMGKQNEQATRPVAPQGVHPTNLGTVRIMRDMQAWRDAGSSYRIEIDGSKKGTLRRGAHRDILLRPGQHSIRISKGWRGSHKVKLAVEANETRVLECGPTPLDEPSRPEDKNYIRLVSLTQPAPSAGATADTSEG
jgi:hypothetical protein